MKTFNAPPLTPSLAAYRQTTRSCHQMGICLHPESSCNHHCRQAQAQQEQPPLGLGQLDGPHYPQHSYGERLSRTLLLVICIGTALLVLVQLAGLR